MSYKDAGGWDIKNDATPSIAMTGFSRSLQALDQIVRGILWAQIDAPETPGPPAIFR
jgi:hypothetical protein